MIISKPSDYVSYFEAIARQHVQLNHTSTACHFAYGDIENLMTNQRSNLLYPALLLEWYEASFHNEFEDNILHAKTGAFSIVSKNNTKGNLNDDAILDACQQIGLDIIARIRTEGMEYETSPAGFDLTKVRQVKITALGDQLHGWRFEFPLWQGLDSYLMDNNKWNFNA